MKILPPVVLCALVIVVPSAFASDLVETYRLGASAGRYESSGEATIAGPGISGKSSLDDHRRILSGYIGAALSGSKFFGDASLEMMEVRSFDLTEINVIGGMRLDDRWGIFAGGRFAWQGNGEFDDDFYKERGPVIGFTYFTPISKLLTFGITGAYNRSSFYFQDDHDDANGFSAKAQLGVRGTGHTFGIRYRQFDLDRTSTRSDPNTGDELTVDVDFREQYLTAFYQYAITR